MLNIARRSWKAVGRADSTQLFTAAHPTSYDQVSAVAATGSPPPLLERLELWPLPLPPSPPSAWPRTKVSSPNDFCLFWELLGGKRVCEGGLAGGRKLSEISMRRYPWSMKGRLAFSGRNEALHCTALQEMKPFFLCCFSTVPLWRSCGKRCCRLSGNESRLSNPSPPSTLPPHASLIGRCGYVEHCATLLEGGRAG